MTDLLISIDDPTLALLARRAAWELCTIDMYLKAILAEVAHRPATAVNQSKFKSPRQP